ncbi:PKD domain-containing protein [Micromonospora sp. AMSO31t]|nr:PKD domain-containing protein [Micromonospora sp. AMSO31t]
MTFEARAGTTYLFRTGADFAEQVTFRLDVAPDPEVDFSPPGYEPSMFDTVSFWPSVHDPAGLGIASYRWEFGDGTTTDAQFPRHRFTADGDYGVRLTARTVDGRSASAAYPVVVRTHDVAIDRLAVPSTRAGRTDRRRHRRGAQRPVRRGRRGPPLPQRPVRIRGDRRPDAAGSGGTGQGHHLLLPVRGHGGGRDRREAHLPGGGRGAAEPGRPPGRQRAALAPGPGQLSRRRRHGGGRRRTRQVAVPETSDTATAAVRGGQSAGCVAGAGHGGRAGRPAVAATQPVVISRSAAA